MTQLPDMNPEQQRACDVLQPFVDLEHQLQSRRRMPHYDTQSILLLMATLSPWIPAIIAQANHSTSADLCMKGAVVGMCIAGPFLIWSLATDVRRFLRKKAYLILARRLAPLEPKLQELRESIWACKKQGFLVGQRIELDPLTQALKNVGYSCSPAPKNP